jgi:cysteine desulfurase
MIYLDGHSTTPLAPEVFEAMKPYFLERFGNASQGLHRYNWEARAGVDQAREQIAAVLGVRDKEIIFTSGATEANHLALLGSLPALLESGKKRILSIRIEHASVLGALELMEERGCRVDWVRTDREGRVDFNHLSDLMGADVGLISVALANHEIGTLQDLKRISDLVRSHGCRLHTDAVQAFGKVRFTADSIGADLITISAHKIRGPKGVGALYARRKNPRIDLEPLYLGGGQERRLRPGTPDTPAIVGFGMAAELAMRTFDQDVERMRRLRDRLWEHLSGALEGWVRNSPTDGLPNNLNLSIRGVDGAALFGRLKQVAVSNASACLNGIQDYSQVLTELGVGRDLARATLRIGLGTWNTEAEIDVAAAEMIEVVRDLRMMERQFAEQTGTFSMNGEKS